MKKKVEEFFKKKFTLPEVFGCVCDTEKLFNQRKVSRRRVGAKKREENSILI